VLSLSSLLVDW